MFKTLYVSLFLLTTVLFIMVPRITQRCTADVGNKKQCTVSAPHPAYFGVHMENDSTNVTVFVDLVLNHTNRSRWTELRSPKSVFNSCDTVILSGASPLGGSILYVPHANNLTLRKNSRMGLRGAS